MAGSTGGARQGRAGIESYRGDGRLPFLDGVRGLSAFYVLIFHSLTIAVPQSGQPVSSPLQVLQKIFGYGHMAVCMFIVLSGFSLMLPMSRRNDLTLHGGMRGFFGRRGRRVLPPYYAALGLSILVIVMYQSVSSNAEYDQALSPGSIISHLFLVHNLDANWAYRINGPMWSVATEWQIYFLMPLVLLPLWRRIGAVWVVPLTWAATIAMFFTLPEDGNYYWAAPWFLGSFAFGMWGAEVAFAKGDLAHRLRRLPWGWIAIGSFAILFTVLATGHDDWPYPYLDGIVSVFSVALVLACTTQHNRSEVGSAMTRFFSARPIAALGGFSYSLYLLQHPLLRLTEKVFGSLPLSLSGVLWTQLLVGTPLILAVSWLFAEFVERPFTGGGTVLPWLRRRFGRRRATAVVTAGL